MHKPKQAAIMNILTNLPYTPEGDEQFLQEIKAARHVSNKYFALVEREAAKRPAIYEEVARVMNRRHLELSGNY